MEHIDFMVMSPCCFHADTGHWESANQSAAEHCNYGNTKVTWTSQNHKHKVSFPPLARHRGPWTRYGRLVTADLSWWTCYGGLVLVDLLRWTRHGGLVTVDSSPWPRQGRLITVDSSRYSRHRGLVQTQMVGLIYCLLSSFIVLLLSIYVADSWLESKHSPNKSLRFDIKKLQPIRLQHSVLKTTASCKYWWLICSSDGVSLA